MTRTPEDAETFELELTVKDINEFFDSGEPIEEIDNRLDMAQGYAKTSGKVAYVVIKVTP